MIPAIVAFFTLSAPVGATTGFPPGNAWQSVSPTPTGNDIFDSQFGEGTFVAVGRDASYSFNGLDWQNVSLGVGQPLTGLAYGNGRFVGVGGELFDTETFEQVAFSGVSENGESWTIHKTSVATSFIDVAFGGGTFVAVGLSGTIATSSDGVTWALRSSGTSEDLFTVAFGDGTFLVGGSGDTVLRSTNNGGSWSSLSTGFALSWRSIGFGDGVFVMTAGPTELQLYSENAGTSWTRIDQPFGLTSQDHAILDVVYNTDEGFWVGVGFSVTDTGAGTRRPMTSQDGRTWQIINHTFNTPATTIMTGNNRIVVNGDDGFTQTTLINDGTGNGDPVFGSPGIIAPANPVVGAQLTFTANATDPDDDPLTYVWDFGDGRAYPNAASVDYFANTGGLITVRVEVFDPFGNDSSAQTSLTITDPLNDGWDEQSIGVDTDFSDVDFAGDLFIATGEDLAVSRDGIGWVTREVPGTLANAAAGNGRYIVVGEFLHPYTFDVQGQVLSSPDGNTWSRVRVDLPQALNGITFGLGRFVAVGNQGYLATSRDGVTWSQLSISGNRTFEDVAFDGTRFLAVGQLGALFTSPDGLVWTEQNDGAGFPIDWVSVATSGGTWVISGSVYRATSTDGGVTWALNAAPENFDGAVTLTDITFGSGQFIGTGFSDTDGNEKVLRSVDGFEWFAINQVFGTTQSAIATDGNRAVSVGPNGIANTSFFVSSQGNTPPNAALTGGFLDRDAFDRDPFTSSASDPDADPFVRSWQFGDNTFAVADPSPAKAYHIGGEQTVTLRVTDDRGGVRSVTESFDVNSPLTTWTEPAISTTKDLHAITFDGEAFLAVGIDGIFRSPTGTAWTRVDDSGTFFGVTQGDGVRIAVGTASNDGYIARSANGQTWTGQTIANTVAFEDVAYLASADIFVAVGRSGDLFSSDNGGVTWTRRSSATGNTLRAIAAVGDRFYAVGDSGTVVTSTNGTTWSALDVDEYENVWLDVIDLAGAPYLVGLENIALSTNDGQTWAFPVAPVNSPYPAQVRSAAAINGLLVLTGTDSSVNAQRIYASPDGRALFDTGFTTGNAQNGLAFGAGVFVSVGDGGDLYRSATVGATNQPSIVATSLNADIENGESTAVSVEAEGSGPIGFQWYLGQTGDTSSPIAGANAPVYLTPSLTGTTDYWAQVINDDGSRNSATITITPNQTAINRALLITSAGGGTATASPSQSTYPDGTVVDITATPSFGFEFVNWTGAGVTNANAASTTVVMNADRTIEAVFRLKETGYGGWIRDEFGVTTNPGIIGPEVDGDDDGIPNIAEYAFGSPTDSGDVSNLPRGEGDGAGGFTIVYTRVANATDIDYILQERTSLISGDWADRTISPQFEAVTPLGNGYEEVSVTLNASADATFFRILIVAQ